LVWFFCDYGEGWVGGVNIGGGRRKKKKVVGGQKKKKIKKGGGGGGGASVHSTTGSRGVCASAVVMLDTPCSEVV